MSTVMETPVTADAAAGAAAGGALKRKLEGEDAAGGDTKMPKLDAAAPFQTPAVGTPAATPAPAEAGAAGKPMSKAREIRLEQNRKAARESRRRKKTMIEELQRSVIFFSRANSTLKQQNDELSTVLMQSQVQIAAIESGQQPGAAQAAVPQVQAAPIAQQPTPVQPVAAPVAPAPVKAEGDQGNAFQQAQAHAVATQAVLESQGFPAAAARAAAQTMNAGAGQPAPVAGGLALQPAAAPGVPPMQPGATMQAMASFQQAAAAAMQSAMQGMQGIPGVNMTTLASPPIGSNPQQAYTDTMTAFAMQQAAAQAAAAAAGHQVSFFPGAPFMTPMMWPTQVPPGTVMPIPQMQVQPAAAPVAPVAAPVAAQPAAPVAAQPAAEVAATATA